MSNNLDRAKEYLSEAQIAQHYIENGRVKRDLTPATREAALEMTNAYALLSIAESLSVIAQVFAGVAEVDADVADV